MLQPGKYLHVKTMQYLFDTPIPLPWLVADLLTIIITVLVVSM
jgi:hypothetical protein